MNLKQGRVRWVGVFLSFLAVGARASECDYKTGIKKLDQGFLYSRECHLHTGRLVLDLKDYTLQTEKLTRAIELKDLALNAEYERSFKWKESALKLDDSSSRQAWLFFGIGVGVALVSVFAAGTVVRR